jgi:hypothetical protein
MSVTMVACPRGKQKLAIQDYVPVNTMSRMRRLR